MVFNDKQNVKQSRKSAQSTLDRLTSNDNADFDGRRELNNTISVHYIYDSVFHFVEINVIFFILMCLKINKLIFLSNKIVENNLFFRK